MLCVNACWPPSANWAKGPPQFPAVGQIPGWCLGWSSKLCSILLLRAAKRRQCPRRAKAGRRLRENWACKAYTLLNVIPKKPTFQSLWALSSTPGQWKGLFQKANSLLNWAGGRMRKSCQKLAAVTALVQRQRSILKVLVVTHAYALGCHISGRSMVFLSPTMKQFQSRTITL